MASPFLGQLKIFGGNFAPLGFAFCNGQAMDISQNSALFSLFGTTYGGNGTTTFNLPDLRGRVPIHFSTTYPLGSMGGAESVVLNTAQMPAHTHASTASPPASSQPATHTDPAGRVFAVPTSGQLAYAASASGSMAGGATSGIAGSGQAHTNVQPYLAVNYIVALEGIYPSRN